MKKYFGLIAMFVAVALVTPVLTSCGDDDEETVVLDKTALTEALNNAKSLLASATTADYPAEAIATYRTTVSSIETAMGTATTQTAIDNLLTQLNAATATFEASAYGAIPEGALTCKWDFDTNSNGTYTSTGKYAWKAVSCKAEEIFGSNAEVKVVDGISGKAVELAEGAHLEVSDFNRTAILGSQISVSAWVKTSKDGNDGYANNYIVSFNHWNSWKMQVQGQNKPFMTFMSDAGCCDADNETDQSVKSKEWTMITCVLDLKENHTLTFYINGEPTKTWTSEQKDPLKGSTLQDWTTYGEFPLFIGIGANSTIATAAWTWEWTAGSLSAFYGAIDNLEIYNIALTDGQVAKLYKNEK